MTLSTRIIAVTSLLALAGSAAPAQSRAHDPAVLLQAAAHQETVAGNLDSAIALYRRVASDKRADRATAAKALVSMGRAYETLGSAEARKAYERVVREFGDQPTHADVARERLATLASNGRPVHAGGPVARRLWAGAGVDLMGDPSPDGKRLTFTDWSTGELAVRDLGAGTQRDLTRSGGWDKSIDYSEISVWSRDGKQVAFTWYNKDDRYDLRIVPAEGGEPRVLLVEPDGDYFWVEDWSPDGKQLLMTFAALGANKMTLVSTTDGSRRVLKTFDWRWPLEMSFSPDGRWIAYDFPPVEDSLERDIYMMAADGSREVVVVRHAADDRLMGWAPDGSGIFFTTNRRGVTDLVFQPVRDGQARGDFQMVKAEVGAISPLGFRGGDFYYGARTGGVDVYVGEIDFATGKIVTRPTRLPARMEGRNHHPAWSPDGRQLAYFVESTDQSSRRMIAIRSLADGTERRLATFNFLRVFELHWSPDQKAIFFSGNNRRGGVGIYRLDLETGKQTMVIGQEGNGIIGRRPDTRMFDLTPDGRHVIYWRSGDKDQGRPHRILAHDLARDSSRVVYAASLDTTGLGFYGLAVSPDGREVAFGQLYGAPVTTGASINVVPLAGGPARRIAERPRPAAAMAWINGGRDILVEADPDGASAEQPHRHELWRVPAAGGAPQRLTVDEPHLVNLRLHPDGRRFALSFGQSQAEVWVLENVLPKQAASRR